MVFCLADNLNAKAIAGEASPICASSRWQSRCKASPAELLENLLVWVGRASWSWPSSWRRTGLLWRLLIVLQPSALAFPASRLLAALYRRSGDWSRTSTTISTLLFDLHSRRSLRSMTAIWLPFRFTIKEIEPCYDVQERLIYSPQNPYWIPPTIPDAIRTTDDLGVYQWRPGQVERVDPAVIEGLDPCSASSMFWCEDLDRKTYLHTPYDCTKRSVEQTAAERDQRYHWRRLTFHNTTTSQGVPLSLVGHHYGEDKIAASGAAAWMPELLPETFMRKASLRNPQECRLAGDVSMLLSLMALSTHPSTVIQTIRQSFRPDTPLQTWRHHGRTGSKESPVHSMPS